MIRPIISSMIRPIISSMVDPFEPEIKRYFARLDSALTSHYTYDDVLFLDPSDTFEFDWVAPSALTPLEYLTDGDDGVDRGRLSLSSDGTYNFDPSLTLEVNGVPKINTDDYPIDGKLYKIKITSVTAIKIKYLGTNSSLINPHDGIMANPVATIGGVTTSNIIGLSTGNTELSNEGNNTLTYVNIPDSNRTQYTLTNGEWIGAELQPQPFHTDDYEKTNNGTAVPPNQFDFTSSGQGMYRDYEFIGTVLMNVDIDADVATTLQLRDSPNGLLADPLIASGAAISLVDFVYFAAKGGTYIRNSAVATGRFTVHEMSVIPLIEIAV